MSLKRRDSTNQGGGLRVAADDPHLVSLGGGRLSTAVTIHQLPVGNTTIGSAPDCHIVLSGTGVLPHHCTLHRTDRGAVTLYPTTREARVSLDGKRIDVGAVVGTALSQGVMITIGKSNYLRFNHPAEAELMRSTIGSQERLSMPPMDFAQDSGSSEGSGSSTDGISPSDDMMSMRKPAAFAVDGPNLNNFHSPKVFAADSVTMNAPAKDVLGAKFNNFTKNLTQMFGKNEKCEKSAGGVGGQRKVNNTAAAAEAEQTAAKLNNAAAQAQSQAIVVGPKVQQFSACYDRYPKPGSYGMLQVFPMNNVNNEMNTETMAAATKAAPAAPSAASVTSSVHPPALTELQRQRAQIERMQEEQISAMEHDRLEEILKMCADFERQNEAATPPVQSSPIVQNRIKTNGSLPREKKALPPSDTGGTQHFFFPGASPSAGDATPSKSGYENVHIGPGRQVHIGGSAASEPSSAGDKPVGYVPQSPRTKIRTCVSPKRDPSGKRAEYDALVQSFEEKLRLEIQLLRDGRTATAQQQQQQQQQQPSQKQESVYGTLEKRPTRNVNGLTVTVDTARLEQLRTERGRTLGRVREVRGRIAELQRQDEEARRGLDMERALITAELATEQTHLQNLLRNIGTLHAKIQRTETQRAANRTLQETQQRNLKQTIDHKQSEVEQLGSLLSQHGHDESVRADLNRSMDELETHSKCYEDLEFQCFEEEAEWSAHHEELLGDLRTLRRMAADKERHCAQLHAECGAAEADVATRPASSDARALRAELRQLREKVRTLDGQLFELTGTREQSLSSDEEDDAEEEDDDEELVVVVEDSVPETKRPKHPLPMMSQSLFGSQECLATKSGPPSSIDLMSRSVNENMFFTQHNIESRTPFTSTPVRGSALRSVDIGEDTEAAATNPMQMLKYNLSPPFQHKSSSAPSTATITTTEEADDAAPLRHSGGGSSQRPQRGHLNLSIESDDFEVNPLERRVPSQDDIDRISKITLDAPISTQGASFKVIESIREIERNRQLLLKQQGSHVIEHERQKMHELKKRSHDEARAQYLMKGQAEADAGASGSSIVEGGSSDERDSYANKDRCLENGLPLTNGARPVEEQPLNTAGNNNNQQPQQQQQRINGAAGGSTNNNQLTQRGEADTTSPHRHSQPDFDRARPLSDATSDLNYDHLADKPFKSSTDIRLAAPHNGNNGAQSSSPHQPQHHLYQQHQQHLYQQQRHSQASQDSQGSDEGGQQLAHQQQQQQQQQRSLVAGSKRNLPKHQRPLTRYLPIMSLDLDLRQHIESAGHQVALCPHVLLDAHSCRGYLHKLGATFHGWSRRWFLFDRQKMALIYFSDKSERKPRGGAYFSTIDEVYLDHMNTSKSGRPYCTFIVKTKKRSYHLQAASDAAARIWIDAIITGAQGNIDY